MGSSLQTPTFQAKVSNLTDANGITFDQFLPPGTVLPFAGTTAPNGFLICNGNTISRTTYARLFSAIGTAHGSGDGSTTFHLPDYRGRFLRGTDGGAARDPDRAGRTAANSGGATGDNVGSVQTNATAKNGLTASSTNPTFTGSAATSGNQSADHSHYARDLSGNISITAQGGSGWAAVSGATNGSSHTTSGMTASHTHTLTAAGSNATPTITVGAGDNETRPVNANVNYIIKI